MNSIIIGLGSMGKRRIRLLKKLYPAMKIFGFDSNEERAKAVAEEYQIQLVTDLQQVSLDLEIAYAFICTAPLAHGELISLCLKQGWHVFSEINLVTDKYEENMALAKKEDKVLFLSSTPIYRSEMQYIMEVVAKADKPVQYCYQVGQYLPDWHPWETVNNFFVSNVRTSGCRELFAIELPWMVKAFGEIEKITGNKGRFSTQGPAIADSYHLNIVHKNGNMGTLLIDVVRRKALRELQIFNEQIYCEWQGTPDSLMLREANTGEMAAVGQKSYWNQEGYDKSINEYAYMNEISEFFKVVKEKKEAQYTFEDDKKILEIIDQMEGAENENMYGGFGFYRETSFTKPE